MFHYSASPSNPNAVIDIKLVASRSSHRRKAHKINLMKVYGWEKAKLLKLFSFPIPVFASVVFFLSEKEMEDMPLRCKLMENSINLNNWKSHKRSMMMKSLALVSLGRRFLCLCKSRSNRKKASPARCRSRKIRKLYEMR